MTRRDARSRSTFATLHRLLGVGIGEHLGYLLTGAWTLLVAASILATTVLPAWLGFVGIPIGVALLVGTLEFVGPNERDGWPLAGTIVPIAYIAWSVWLDPARAAAARLTRRGGASDRRPEFPSVPGDDGSRGPGEALPSARRAARGGLREARWASVLELYRTQIDVLWNWSGGRVALVKRLLITLVVATIAFAATAWLLPERRRSTPCGPPSPRSC